ncbi:ATP-binding protein [Streptomyces griseoaurantiacus]|uniref:ATP-binding protein n=1 Tax=Streptomyces griseoaurantiacus TaxID=68213 RepID=UPI0036B63AE4
MHSPFLPPPSPVGSLRYMNYERDYPSLPQSVPEARDHFMQAVRRSGLDQDTADAALVCLSELATNAVRHARDPRPEPLRRFRVCSSIVGRRDRRLRLAVQDPDRHRIPLLPPPGEAAEALVGLDPDCPSGRGLLLVATYAPDCGILHGPSVRGKVIWCRLPLNSTQRRQEEFPTAADGTGPAIRPGR